VAKIEDLVAQIPDERLKKAISSEVRELKKKKTFGLVFEEHLPEKVRLPKLAVREGELVAKIYAAFPSIGAMSSTKLLLVPTSACSNGLGFGYSFGG
jgi:hypothetical protein